MSDETIVAPARATGTPGLAKALCAAQSAMAPAKKELSNPFFKSMYADLAGIIDAIRKPFGDNGLSYVQLASSDKTGVTVTTRLMHVSGEQIESSLWMPLEKLTPQSIGSAITYASRYGLRAMAGVPAEDDDGNSASKSDKIPAPVGMEGIKAQLSDTKQRTHQAVTFRYGNSKGKSSFDVPVSELEFYAKSSAKQVADPEKAQFIKANTLEFAALNAEINFRSQQ